MDDFVSISWNTNGECSINLRSAVFNLPLSNWKRLMRLMADNPEINSAEALKMHKWFSAEMANPISPFRETKKLQNKLYQTYKSLIFKGEM